MLKLKGHCTIHVIDSISGKTKQVIEKENLVTDNSRSQLIAGGIGGSFSGVFSTDYQFSIFISQSTSSPTLNPSGITILADAYTPSGVTKIQFFNSSTPVYGQVQQRIDFTGTARVFQTVGLRNTQFGNNGIFAYLLLDTPCTQGAFDILDIFYRIEFINIPGQGIVQNSYITELIGRTYFGLSGSVQISPTAVWAGEKHGTAFPYQRYATSRLANASYNPASTTWLISSGFGSHFNYIKRHVLNRNQFVGWLFGTIEDLRVDGNWFASMSSYVKPGSPFHPIFKHNQNSVVPFFESLTFGQGAGNIALSGTWTGRIPDLYKIVIINGGATGVATYKWMVRKHIGFEGNTFTDLKIQSPYRGNDTANGFYGSHPDLLKYELTKIVQYGDNGLTILDFWDGWYRNYDANTTPQLPVTQLRQCAVDEQNKLIYCACRATGLWIIDVVANTIAHPLGVGCYGVDVGRNNVAYVLAEGGLYASTDWNNPLTFSYTGISDNNWSRVYFLKCDPQNAEDRIAFSILVPPSSSRVVWYRRDTAATSVGYTGSRNYCASLDVSDTGGFWASIDGIMNFGTTSLTQFPANPGLSSAGIDCVFHVNTTIAPFGTQRYGKMTFFKESLILNTQTINSGGVKVSNHTALSNINNAGVNGESQLLHVDDGMVVANSFVRQSLSGGTLVWQEYGWDGANWVLGHSGAKTTHATPQLLNNGIQIAFSDGASTPHFVTDNFFTTSVNKGILKDNATSVNFSSSFYSVGVIFNAVQSSVIIPAVSPYTVTIDAKLNDPLFRMIERDNPSYAKFKINGVDVTATYFAGQSPSVNEVSINPTTGVATFNAADAGKTFSGEYAYLQI